jgi:hypothetical protein
MTTINLDTDYLIIGSGAVAMAFADTLFHETDARMVIVDRHHGPGGHWNDAYPFVRLHQPSAYYGVNSRPLGSGGKDATGINAGMCERASAAELLNYYEQVMQAMVASGRVQYYPMCNYTGAVGNEDREHQFSALTSGQSYQVKVHKKLVDTTYLQTAVPSTTPPKYSVAAQHALVPINGIARIGQPPSGYIVVGSGKTGIDACLWLLDNAVPPEAITWIMPRDAWYLNRANVQPGEEFFAQSYGSFAQQLEAVAAGNTVDEVLANLEATGQLLRLDKSITPTMFHGAIMSLSEVAQLTRIKNIVRMGRVQRVDSDAIVLERGSVSCKPGALVVDCSASAVNRRPIVPVFAGRTITPQFIRTVQPTFSAAMIAHVEASYDDEAHKNTLCTVVPLPDQPVHWLQMLAINLGNQHRWSKDKDLQRWIAMSRLDGFTAMAARVTPAQPEKMALLMRYGQSAGPAAAKLQQLLTLR